MINMINKIIPVTKVANFKNRLPLNKDRKRKYGKTVFEEKLLDLENQQSQIDKKA